MSSWQPGTRKDLGCKEGGDGGREDNLYEVRSEWLTSLLNEINLKMMLRKLIWWIMKSVKNAPQTQTQRVPELPYKFCTLPCDPWHYLVKDTKGQILSLLRVTIVGC